MIQRSLVDASAFASVFDRHYTPLYRFLTAHWGHETGGDLASETFLVAFSQREGFDPTRASARPWLFGIAMNLSRMEARRRRREAEATMRGAQRDELEDFAEELVNMMDATQAARDLGIAQALRRLRAEDLGRCGQFSPLSSGRRPESYARLADRLRARTSHQMRKRCNVFLGLCVVRV